MFHGICALCILAALIGWIVDSILARSKRESSAIDYHNKLTMKERILQEQARDLQFQQRKLELDKREAQLELVRQVYEGKIVK